MYAAATRYLAFGQFIGVAIIQVVGPKLSEVLAAHDLDRARLVYSTATWWLMALAWPLYLTMVVLAPSLLSFFGPAYQQADDVLRILGVSMLVATLVGPVDMVLLMAGKSSWNLLNTIVAIAVERDAQSDPDPSVRDDGCRGGLVGEHPVEQPSSIGAGLATDRPPPVRPRIDRRRVEFGDLYRRRRPRRRERLRERRHGTTGHRAHRWSRVSGGALAIPHDAPLLGTSGEPSRQVGSIGTARHPLGQLPHADLRCRPGQRPRADARGLCAHRSYVITGPMKPLVPIAGSSVQNVAEKV